MFTMLHLVLLAAGHWAFGIQEMAAAESCSWQDAFVVNGKCFKYVLKRKTWIKAQDYCEELPGGGVLAQITSQDEMNQLKPSKFSSNFWVGANDIKVEGVWRWTDRTPANLTGLWGRLPDDTDNNEDCVMIYPSGGLNDLSCNTELPFICMKKPGCFWRESYPYRGSCFVYYTASSTWSEAEQFCNNLPGGGMLAQITSQTDLFNLEPAAKGFNSYFWIGGNDIRSEGVWRWSDGTSANLKGLWGTYQPDNKDNEDCVMAYATGGINDLRCDSRLNFICMDKPMSNDPCWQWPGATHNDGRCFKYVSDRRNWADSQAYCQSLPGGGMLASVRSDAERKLIAPEKNGLNDKAWSGLNDIDFEGQYVWANKEPARVSYLWAPGEPNNFYNEDCAYFNPNGLLNDSNCEDLLASVCMLVL